ncbi:MAG: transglutaminase-like domain-containing protein, partial [Muribaculaceae bacterium]|nr:transglutaminase-like domain-containing protein [Muribaculaceae bacterium]
MNLTYLFAPLLFIAAIATNLEAAIITPEIEKDFQSRRAVIEQAGRLCLGELNLTKDQEDCLKMLYAYMPLPDMTDRSPEYYLEYVVTPALKARAEMPWGKSVDDTLFRHFVLPVRVNNEPLDHHRPEFFSELKDRVKGLSMKDAILEVNHWCHEKVTYQPSDGRTHSPSQSVSSAIGRCGEESTFTVAALRSVGIPARQVYTPRWAHTDDNHAWVEAWADGKWYFLGACEPEPILNLGWFNAPASRGMLMHARVFGNYSGGEEQLDKIEGITFINVTDNYAPVDTITVTALYPDNSPAADAKATFRLYNYAEFYPIAEKTTDINGNASLIAGLGDLLIWVTDGTNFGYEKCSVGKDKNIKVVLDKTANTPFSIDLDIVPPVGRNDDTAVSDNERARNDARLKTEDALRNAYMATFLKDKESHQLAQKLGVDTVSVADIMKMARGNHTVICNFLAETSIEDRQKAITLLQSLTEKDLSDVTIDVLTDHIRATDFTTGNNFGPYVMSPRIDMEELTPYRKFFESVYTADEASFYRDNPKEWVKWVADSIVADQTWYPQQITMSPESVWKNRKTSSKSRDLFFVAGARSFGIPARIDAVTGKTQWADKSGNWIDANFSANANEDVSHKQG